MEARTRNDDADISLELDEAAIVPRAYEHSQRATAETTKRTGRGPGKNP
jgi:hypothetical protein